MFKNSFRRHKAYCKKLGLEPSQQSHLAVGDLYHLKVLPKECFIYVAHAFGLAVFALLCVHVQVRKLVIFLKRK